MKRILLLGLSLLLLAQVALAIPAGMAVRSERGLPFRLRLDGYRIGGRWGMTDVRFNRLAPGTHWAEFQVPANGGVLNYRTQVQLLPGRETRFVLVTRRGYPPVLQRVNEAPLPGWAGGRGPGRPDDYGYQAQPTPFGGPNAWPAPGGRDDWYGPNDDAPYGNGGYGQNGPGTYPSQPPAGNYPSQPGNNGGYPPASNGNNGYPPIPNGNGGYPQPGNNGGYGNNYRHLLTPQETDQLIQAVKARAFEEQKVLLAKQALAESDIRSEDLRRLLQSGFDFDRGKLELAKFAYGRVVDRQNFYRVYEAFSFESSIRDMQQYIEQNRGA